jgi:5'-3' exonuclease
MVACRSNFASAQAAENVFWSVVSWMAEPSAPTNASRSFDGGRPSFQTQALQKRRRERHG